MSGRRGKLRRAAPGAPVVLAIGLALGLAVACEQQAPVDSPAVDAAPGTAAPEATARVIQFTASPRRPNRVLQAS